jgi:hypothetical protein
MITDNKQRWHCFVRQILLITVVKNSVGLKLHTVVDSQGVNVHATNCNFLYNEFQSYFQCRP